MVKMHAEQKQKERKKKNKRSETSIIIWHERWRDQGSDEVKEQGIKAVKAEIQWTLLEHIEQNKRRRKENVNTVVKRDKRSIPWHGGIWDGGEGEG